MKTELLYSQDSYQMKSSGKILDIQENEKGKAIILDRTIFHPRGGGQPNDQGVISNDKAKFKVTMVRADENGTILHWGEYEYGNFNTDDIVSLQIDEELRLKSMKCHSAGHLIDCATQQLNLPIKAVRGHHFDDNPFVEYEGILDKQIDMIPIIQNALNELLRKDLPISSKILSENEIKEKKLIIPKGKIAREVTIEGFPACGCGGTHVKRTSEIGKITIHKIKSKKGKTKVFYNVG